MPAKKRTETAQNVDRNRLMVDRLALIKERHRKLILGLREQVAESTDNTFDLGFEDAYDQEELELTETRELDLL